MTDLQDFIRRQCVYSKLAEKPVVGQHGSLQLVFIHGYPMTLRGFYALTTRAVFGSTIPMFKKVWDELNAETVLLCAGLNLELKEGRESQSIIEGIRAAAGWNEETAKQITNYQFDREFLFKWIETVEAQVAELRGISPLDQPPQ